MEVVNGKAAFLSNYEVFELLKELKEEEANKKLTKGRNFDTLVYCALKYLKNTPCAQQSEKTVTEFLTAIKEFELTEAECLQILNLRPSTEVELQLIIEEVEDRLTTEQTERLLELVSLYLGEPDKNCKKQSNEKFYSSRFNIF